MALFLAIMLENPDRNARLVAAVFLIIFAQVREISLVNDATGGLGLPKKKRHSPAQPSPAPASAKKAEPEHKWDEKDKQFLRSFSSSWMRERARV